MHSKGSAQVSPPRASTAVLVDLRNFTPNLKASPTTNHGTKVFCELLAEFYGVCVEAATLAVGVDEHPPVYLNSTGDGVLMVFFAAGQHARHAYLTTLLLNSALKSVCTRYNAEHGRAGIPTTSFGIGVESGQVCRVTDTDPSDTVVVETYIGDCINVAARVEGMTKMVHETHTIVGAETNNVLCHEFFDLRYEALMDRCLIPDLTDAQRLATYDQMTALNRQLCLAFMHLAVLKGVDEPLPLFRVVEVHRDNSRFQSLLRLLSDSATHCEEALAFIDRYSG